MQKEKGKRQRLRIRGWCLSVFLFPFSFFLVFCGAPGDPTPPRPPVPVAVSDLAARQSGESVVLTFTLPVRTTEGEILAEPPDVEIFRGFAGTKIEHVYTIPGALVETYLGEGRMRFVDPLKPADLARGTVFYRVRTRASPRRASADSNEAAVRVLPVPERIRAVRARVTESAVELEWDAPAESPAGYRVYRGELEPGAALPAELSPAALKSPLALLGPAAAPAFRDTSFEFGRAYVYVVRSVAQAGPDSAESADSEPVVVTPRDTFAPAPPENLVAVYVPPSEGAPAEIELSWSIGAESDLAGYRVYRVAGAGTPPELLNRELLRLPTFRDTSIAGGERYRYTVTAVDRAGNESPHSAPATADVPPANR
jgi:hypothetical protein